MSRHGSLDLVANHHCPICAARSRVLVNLPHYPVTEIYQPYGRNNFPFPTAFDQSLRFCDDCSHAFIGALLPRDFIYQNYLTATRASHGASIAISNFHQFIRENGQEQPDVIVDIGANDTLLLKLFADGPARLIGVDPNISGDSPRIETVKGYIEDVEMSQLKGGKRWFMSSHTLEHIYDPATFLAQLAAIATPTDEFFFQFPSLDLLVRDARFDQVHHQHIHYFSLQSISALLAKTGFSIISHHFDPDHYGALMIYFKKGQGRTIGTPLSARSLQLSYGAFQAAMTASNQRIELCQGDFVCYGAALMLPVLSYYMPAMVNAEVIVDDNPTKHGLSYINYDVRIVGSADCSLADRNVVVTTISTKLTTRRIVENLIRRQVMNIILPFNTL